MNADSTSVTLRNLQSISQQSGEKKTAVARLAAAAAASSGGGAGVAASQLVVVERGALPAQLVHVALAPGGRGAAEQVKAIGGHHCASGGGPRLQGWQKGGAPTAQARRVIAEARRTAREVVSKPSRLSIKSRNVESCQLLFS
jgi:hypothetical protein